MKKPPKKMIYDEDLLKWIRENFYLYRKVKGRDILYNIYINQGNYVSTYVFQKHYEFLGLKSIAYKKQGKPAPKRKSLHEFGLKIISKVNLAQKILVKNDLLILNLSKLTTNDFTYTQLLKQNPITCSIFQFLKQDFQKKL
ncbi:hypothetical protein RNM28_03315 [Mesomycoplasma ovipneumoniae]|uniref:hypothetical protein n=1 Tax=Mesomycoplasma ovipneumoniae TaxID=29562 RepID=UPI0028AE7A6D|nr:hypothetical protein [Mesomycoplasma ovipneumoniae]WNM17165.1 hypothetical protein RNM28_03315 [Mesomycoplasma ovipneumoniae]